MSFAAFFRSNLRFSCTVFSILVFTILSTSIVSATVGAPCTFGGGECAEGSEICNLNKGTATNRQCGYEGTCVAFTYSGDTQADWEKLKEYCQSGVTSDGNFDWYNPSIEGYQDNVYDPNKKTEMGIDKTVTSISHLSQLSLATDMIGLTDPVARKLGMSSGGGAVSFFSGGISHLVAAPPAKPSTYIADLGNQIGLVKPAYAQGMGYQALSPVLQLWKAFRNIAYLGFVIIFVVVGFMIMFRARISPQAVVTVQAAIPQIVVTLLLVTFSYAIAAFIIDLIYILIYLTIAAFHSFGIFTQASNAQQILFEKNIFAIALQDLMGGPFGNQPLNQAASAVDKIISDIVGGAAGKIMGWIGHGLAYLIFAAAILIAVFRLFFQLLMAYIGLIISTIFAPIIILFNALPGSQSFNTWLKGIFANAIVFPVTALMILIAGALVNSTSFAVNDNIGYDYNNVGGQLQLPFIGGGFDSGAIMALVSIGLLMLLPQVNTLIQEALGIKGGIFGAAAAALGGIQVAWQVTGQRALGKYQQASQEAAQHRRDKIIHTQSANIDGYTTAGHNTWVAGKTVKRLLNPFSK